MKKTKQHHKKNNTDLFDMSHRKNIVIEFNDLEPYDKEEILSLLKEIQEQRETVEKEYYSINASVERISERSFIDILRAKWDQWFHNRDKNS